MNSLNKSINVVVGRMMRVGGVGFVASVGSRMR